MAPTDELKKRINAEVDKSSLRFKGLLNYAKRIKKVSSLHYTKADS